MGETRTRPFVDLIGDYLGIDPGLNDRKAYPHMLYDEVFGINLTVYRQALFQQAMESQAIIQRRMLFHRRSLAQILLSHMEEYGQKLNIRIQNIGKSFATITGTKIDRIVFDDTDFYRRYGHVKERRRLRKKYRRNR